MKIYRVFWFYTLNDEHSLYSLPVPASSVEAAAAAALELEKLNPMAKALSVESTEGLHESMSLESLRE
jgi:hypothetical protein